MLGERLLRVVRLEDDFLRMCYGVFSLFIGDKIKPVE